MKFGSVSLVLALCLVCGTVALADVFRDKEGLIEFELPANWESRSGAKSHFHNPAVKECVLSVEALSWPESVPAQRDIEQVVKNLESQKLQIVSKKVRQVDGWTELEVRTKMSRPEGPRHWHHIFRYGRGLKTMVSLMATPGAYSSQSGVLRKVVSSVRPRQAPEH